MFRMRCTQCEYLEFVSLAATAAQRRRRKKVNSPTFPPTTGGTTLCVSRLCNERVAPSHWMASADIRSDPPTATMSTGCLRSWMHPANSIWTNRVAHGCCREAQAASVSCANESTIRAVAPPAASRSETAPHAPEAAVRVIEIAQRADLPPTSGTAPDFSNSDLAEGEVSARVSARVSDGYLHGCRMSGIVLLRHVLGNWMAWWQFVRIRHDGAFLRVRDLATIRGRELPSAILEQRTSAACRASARGYVILG